MTNMMYADCNWKLQIIPELLYPRQPTSMKSVTSNFERHVSGAEFMSAIWLT